MSGVMMFLRPVRASVRRGRRVQTSRRLRFATIRTTRCPSTRHRSPPPLPRRTRPLARRSPSCPWSCPSSPCRRCSRARSAACPSRPAARTSSSRRLEVGEERERDGVRMGVLFRGRRMSRYGLSPLDSIIHLRRPSKVHWTP